MPSPYIIGPDPDWARQQSERWGNALMVLGQMMDKRKREREERMYRDLAVMQSDPTLATGKFGQDFMQRYGSVPGAEGLYQSFVQQGQEELSERDALNSYYMAMAERQKAEESMQQEEETRRRFLESAQFVGPRNPQLEIAGRVQDAIRDRAEGSIEWQAINQLDPALRATAMRAMQERKMPLPKAPEPMMLPDDAIAAAMLGGTPGQIQQAGLVDLEVVPSAGALYQGQLAKEAYARNVDEKQRQEAVAAEAAALKFERQQALKQTPPGRAPRGEKEPKTPEQGVEAAASAMQKDYKNALDEAKAIPSDKEKAEKLSALPKPPPANIVALAKQVFKGTGVSPEDAASEFSTLWFEAMARSGNDYNQAVLTVRKVLQIKRNELRAAP